jgi:Putative porin
MGIRKGLGLTALLGLGLLPFTVTHAADDERQSLDELHDTVLNLLQALVDQGVISREKATQMVKAAQDKAAADAAAQAKADEGAVRVPYVPQIVKDEIAKQVAEEVKPAVTQDVIAQAKTDKWGVPGAMPDWLSRVRISGEVTLRGESLLYNGDNAKNEIYNYYAINQAGSIAAAGQNAFLDVDEARDRFRGRARLAIEGDLSDSWTAGMRLVTGNTTDLVSETQTVDGTAPYAFGLDELFIKLDERNDQLFPYLTTVVGRFVNPYETPTDLIFHKDLTFTGTALTYRLGLGDGSPDQSDAFFTMGAHQLQEIEFSSQDKWLVAGQLGTNLRWGDINHLRLSAAFFDYFNVTGRFNPIGQPGLYNYTAPQFMRYGNTVFDIANGADPSTNLFAYASKFRLGNVNAVYGVDVGSRYRLSWTVDAVKNFGYNYQQIIAYTGVTPASVVRNIGAQTEVSFGYPTVLQRGAWRATIGYRYLQGDAVMDEYTDSDFHYFGGTNARGYYVVVDYGIANRVWTRLRYLSANQIDGPIFGVDTIQLDLSTRF